MKTATFRFYADLNDFLPPGKRQRTLLYPFRGEQSVKHLIEAAGIPHTEVEAILANGEPAGFDYLVAGGDRVAVYPPFTRLELPMEARLRPPPARPLRFVLDIHLGQLARYLRLLGFDALYPDNNHADADLAAIAHESGRVLLTRDRSLLKRRIVTYGCCLRTLDPRRQLSAVLRRYRLYGEIADLPRCLRCNGELEAVAKAAVLDRLEAKTRRYYDRFHLCRACGQIYWEGSHYPQISRFLDDIRREAAGLSIVE